MAQNDGFRAQRPQRQARILHRFALFDARAETRNQRGVGAQRLGSQLEAGAGTRGRLVEKQRDAALGQNAVAEQRVKVFKLGGARQQPAHALHAQVENRKQRARMVRKWRRWRGRSGERSAGDGRTHLLVFTGAPGSGPVQ